MHEAGKIDLGNGHDILLQMFRENVPTICRHSVHWGINPPTHKHQPPLSWQVPP